MIHRLEAVLVRFSNLLGKHLLSVVLLLAVLCLASGAALAQSSTASNSDAEGQSNTDIAKKLQNPVADLISVPFQSNTNFGFGPLGGTQEVLNIQPVVPFHLNDDWNLITRTIMPLTWQPQMTTGGDSSFGLGNTVLSLFLSPAKPGKWIWGVGPVVLLPATSLSVGTNLWGGGLSAVGLRMDGPWVYGALVNNVWSFGGDSGTGGNKVNFFTLQPFVNYNFGDGWYVTSSPIITSNWLADGHGWTLPLGGGLGKVFRLGKLPINVSLQGYYNAVRPDDGANWQLRSQLTFIF
jgi:hypothetical protein